MFALKIITANGNEIIHAAQDPIFHRASNTITFQGYDNLSNSVTLGEGLTSAGGDVAYLMGQAARLWQRGAIAHRYSVAVRCNRWSAKCITGGIH